MSVINKLASSLQRRDEAPNIELANVIAAAKDKNAVKELVDHLSDKSKDIQHDCIKVLYEIGAQLPTLIAGYATTFTTLLTSKNNRLQWGAMTALNSITALQPDVIHSAIPLLASVAQKGSVITKDQYVAILIKLAAIEEYTNDALALLNEALLESLPNQLPMYAEQALDVINHKYKAGFIKTLQSRLKDIDKESKQKRIEKVLKKLQSK
ncbi:MAG: hypothetical protein QM802_16580 [Agriterribacter sp.]